LRVLEAQVTGVPTRARKSSHKSAHRRPARRKRIRWKSRALFVAVVLVAGWIVWAVAAREFAPASNTQLSRFDAIVVLGDPADNDGNPTPTQLASVTEAVHEYELGVAPRLIVTGAAVKNDYVEAKVMARTAAAQGVPASSIVTEPNARDTIQNACYATRIMKAHNWKSAEVISNASHLPRTAIIFGRMPIEFAVHAAPGLQPLSPAYRAFTASLETLKTMRYLVWARWREQCVP
jgi:uncharacterized SAM-binding protein YcdF (DUF218 family)